jgi:hypothetical protein
MMKHGVNNKPSNMTSTMMSKTVFSVIFTGGGISAS